MKKTCSLQLIFLFCLSAGCVAIVSDDELEQKSDSLYYRRNTNQPFTGKAQVLYESAKVNVQQAAG